MSASLLTLCRSSYETVACYLSKAVVMPTMRRTLLMGLNFKGCYSKGHELGKKEPLLQDRKGGLKEFIDKRVAV